jgi:isopenicillin N synthase-like dioxygenase
MTAGKIPVIDISSIFGGPSQARDQTDRDIMTAATDTGFMTVTGLPDDMLSPATRKRMLSIFDLPQNSKRHLYRQNFDPAKPNVYRGWFPLQSGLPTYKEGIDLGPDIAHGRGRVEHGDPLTEATPLPSQQELPGWHGAVNDYYRNMEATGRALMRSVARGLHLDETIFDDAFARGISTLRLLHYPVRPPESFHGATEQTHVIHNDQEYYLLARGHVDSGFVTLLAQDGVEGLQAQVRDGSWLTVPPIEETLAVNFGKLLARWTGGRIQATLHRVIGNNRQRYSVPFFYEPSADTIIAPLPMAGSEPFEPVTYGDHLWEATTKFVEQKGIAHLRQPRGIDRATV